MQTSLSRFNILALLLLAVMFPVSNSWGQAVAEATDKIQETKEVTFREPRESDGPLAWKFKEGMSLKFAMEQAMTMEMDIGQVQTMKTETKAINELSFSIDSVDESGVASGKNVIDRMKVTSKAPGVLIDFDSDSEDDGTGLEAQMANMLRPMIGQAMTQKMRTNGEVFDVEIPKGMVDGIGGANPQMAAMFSEKTFKDMATKASIKFPSSKPKRGDTWDTAESMEMGPMKINVATGFTYQGISEVDGRSLHVIVGDLKMDFPEGTPGATVEVTDQNSTVTVYFDGIAGHLVKSVLDQNMNMEITAGPQKINQNLKQSMTLIVTPTE